MSQTAAVEPTDMERDIVALVRRHGSGVSFAEMRRIAGFEGDREILLHVLGECLLWQNVSAEACAALRSKWLTDRIEMRQASPLVYAFDGAMLALPIAKQRRKYKTLHWLPVVWRVREGAPA